MVSVVVTQAFSYRGRNVYPGDSIEMEPIDAAVKSHARLVSLLHGQQYQTRHMVADEPHGDGVVIDESHAHQSRAVFDVLSNATQSSDPVKRRRGRPRKVKA